MEKDYNNQVNERIKICEKSKATWVEVASISHVVCEGYLTTVYLTTNKTITCAMLLKQIEKDLVKYGFVRANRSTLVNRKHIHCSIFKKGERTIFVNNFEVKVSRRRAGLFKK